MRHIVVQVHIYEATSTSIEKVSVIRLIFEICAGSCNLKKKSSRGRRGNKGQFWPILGFIRLPMHYSKECLSSFKALAPMSAVICRICQGVSPESAAFTRIWTAEMGKLAAFAPKKYKSAPNVE